LALDRSDKGRKRVKNSFSMAKCRTDFHARRSGQARSRTKMNEISSEWRRGSYSSVTNAAPVNSRLAFESGGNGLNVRRLGSPCTPGSLMSSSLAFSERPALQRCCQSRQSPDRFFLRTYSLPGGVFLPWLAVPFGDTVKSAEGAEPAMRSNGTPVARFGVVDSSLGAMPIGRGHTAARHTGRLIIARSAGRSAAELFD
jgi:hypothetical protein